MNDVPRSQTAKSIEEQVDDARVRWQRARDRASQLSENYLAPGSGYGDPFAQEGDKHRVEAARYEAEQAYREYQDLKAKLPQSPMPGEESDGSLPWYKKDSRVIAALVSAGAAILIALIVHVLGASNSTGQSAQVSNGSAATIYQAGGNINVDVAGASASVDKLSALVVEVRLTCTLAPEVERPPGEVTFMPVGDSHAYLEGDSRIRLDFVSPVRFQELDNQVVRVINRFSMSSASGLFNEPVAGLKAYPNL
ncbi:MAG: hypothetical protein R3C68_16135, partial [Myxococcota bacterium]